VDVDLYVWWVGDDALVPKHERIKVYETKDAGFHPVDKPDIVHVHSLWLPTSHQGCVYARENGIPYVISPHGMLTPWALRQRWWKKLLAMVLYQYHDLSRASLLHATAASEVDDICRLRLKREVAVVPLGTELPSSVDRQSIGADGNDEVRTALFLSRVHPKKGLRNLLNAWASIKCNRASQYQQSDRHWRLVIVGPDEMGHKDELLKLSQTLQLKAVDLSASFSWSKLSQSSSDVDIVFTGPVYGEDKERLHAMADLFVLPTFSENFGAVVIDSLAYGVSVITTKGTPWSELEGQKAEGGEQDSMSARMNDTAAGGRCGWWIDIGVEPLVEALREARNLTDEERAAMGKNGRQLVERKYTWPAVATEMKKVYEQALTDK